MGLRCLERVRALPLISTDRIITLAHRWYCLWENKARADGRRDSNIENYQELWDAGKTRAPIGDRSPAFRFTI